MGILHVGPTKGLTFSPGDLRVAMKNMAMVQFKMISPNSLKQKSGPGTWNSKQLFFNGNFG